MKKIIKNVLTSKVFYLFLIITLLRWQTWSFPLDRDEGAYAYIGSHLFEKGFVPYRDAFDLKPPGIYLIYNISFHIFGQNDFAIRMFGYIFAFINSYLVYLILKYLKLNQKSLLVVLFIYIALYNSPLFEGLGSNTEIFMLTFINTALLIYLSTLYSKNNNIFKYLLVGLFTGFAILIKPNIALNGLIFPIYLLITQKRNLLKKYIAMVFGLLAPISLCIYLFVRSNSFNYFYESVIYFNRLYLAGGFNQIKTYFDLIKQIFVYPPGINIILISTVFLLFKNRKQINNNLILLFIIWTIAFLFQAKILVRNVPHYYFPMLSGVIYLFAWLFKDKTSKYLIIVITIILLFPRFIYLFNSPKTAINKIFGSGSTSRYIVRETALKAKDLIPNGQKVLLIVDEPQILFYSQRYSAARFINSFGNILDSAKDWEINALRTNPRAVFAYDNRLNKQMIDYLKINDYQLSDLGFFASVYLKK